MNKNKILLFFMVFTLVIMPMNIFAEHISNQEYIDFNSETRVKDYTKSKTVVQTYPTVLSIPDYIFYEEYNADIGMMMGGTLYYKSHEYKNGKYYATFSGTLYAGLFRINLDL